MNLRVFCLLIFIFFSSIHIQADDKNANEFHPVDLVSPKRADLMAKYIYAKHREWETNSLFGLNIYYRHLQVWNGFHESVPPKNSFNDFHNAFDRLLDSIKYNGFKLSNAIPLGPTGVICNGAHRLVSCLLYNKHIYVERISTQCDYGFNFFKNLGLERKYLDAMALQYCELKQDSYILVVFPSATGRNEEIEEILTRHAEIVYKKEIFFTKRGALNFTLTAYEHEPFLLNGVNINYAAAQHKALLCFPEEKLKTNAARVYLLQCENLGLIQKCKANIRALFNISNNSVHATDTHAEAIVLSRSLFNDNSIHCLNHRKNISSPIFDQYFESYRNWLALNTEKSEWFCVDSGAVLAAYGLRDCNDLDYLYYKNEIPDFNIPGIDNHSHQLKYHAISLDDILFDPDNYFFYKGIKFCSLSAIKNMKKRRGEKKDIDDIRLIDNL